MALRRSIAACRIHLTGLAEVAVEFRRRHSSAALADRPWRGSQSKQAADFGSHHDAASRLDGVFHRSILAEREVCPRPLVVRDVRPKDSTKMPLIEDDDVVQTLTADRADDAFDAGVLPGRARCRTDGREAEGLDRPTERRVEGRVAVVEEEPRVHVVGKGLAELLSCPCGRGCGVTLTCRMRRPLALIALEGLSIPATAPPTGVVRRWGRSPRCQQSRDVRG
jgi:hypothetical protein